MKTDTLEALAQFHCRRGIAFGALFVLFSASLVHADAPPTTEPDALEVQVYLSRAGFSPGVLDGLWGDNTRAALRAFQSARGLEPTAAADAATLDALDAKSIEPIVEVTLSEADVGGPFADVPDDLMEQAELERLDYESVEEKVAERFHTTPERLRALNPEISFAAGEMIRVPNVEPFRSTGGSDGPAAADPDLTVTVWRSRGVLAVEDASGRLRFWAPVTAGSEEFPLPIGTFAVRAIAPAPTFMYNPELFGSDAEVDHEPAKIAAGPNNPVGTVWIDLDKEHYGIHGTPEPTKIGYASSHGCVRLTNWDADRVAAMVRPGTKVVFVE